MNYIKSIPAKIRFPLYLVIFVFITALAFTVPFGSLDASSVMIGGALLLVAWEAFVYHKGVVPLLLVHLGQALLVGFIVSYFYVSIAPYIEGAEAIRVLVSGLNILAVSAVVLMVLGTMAVYTVTVGRAWVNMLLAYLAADAVFFVGLMAGWEVPFAGIVGAVAGFIFLGVRVFLPVQKEHSFNWKILLNDKKNTILKKRLTDDLEEAGLLTATGVGSAVVGTAKGKTVVAIPVSGDLKVARTSIKVDERDISSVFHELLAEAENHHPSRWKRNNVTLLLVTPHDKKRDRRSVLTVRSKRYPDRIASQAFIVSENHLASVLREL